MEKAICLKYRKGKTVSLQRRHWLVFAKSVQESRGSSVTKHEVRGSTMTHSNAARGELRKVRRFALTQRPPSRRARSTAWHRGQDPGTVLWDSQPARCCSKAQRLPRTCPNMSVHMLVCLLSSNLYFRKDGSLSAVKCAPTALTALRDGPGLRTPGPVASLLGLPPPP